MHALRTFRMSAAIAAATLTLGTLGTGAAYAGKPPPRPTGVTAAADATSLSPTSTSYAVTSGWNAVASATSYKVSLSKGGTTLASGSVSTTAWTRTVTSTPGTATLTVRALVGRRQGKPASIPVEFKDVNGPTGTFDTTCDKETGAASIAVNVVTDDSGSAITRTVDWDQAGVDPVAWTGIDPATFGYPLVEARYAPTVTLEDAAHNQRTVQLPACVVKDEAAPEGAAYSVDRSAAWATYTKVTVTETSAPTDTWSPTPFITRIVDWGDGTMTPVTSGSASHKYATAGDYTPSVTVTDEAHNSVAVPTTAVTVTADTVAPKVKVTLPSARHSVTAWKTLRGTATDGQTGVKKVSLRAVEKRGTAWYGYNAKTHTWVKAASQAKAFEASKALGLKTDSLDRWTATLSKLRKGTLVLKVRALDHVKNRSATLTRQATLTKP